MKSTAVGFTPALGSSIPAFMFMKAKLIAAAGLLRVRPRRHGVGPVPMALGGIAAALLIVVLAPRCAVSAPQVASDAPAFDDVKIKTSNRPYGRLFEFRGNFFFVHNATLAAIICKAYGLNPQQIVDGPEWLDAVKYDIRGRVDAQENLSEEQWSAILQNLAAEQFKFTFHRETRTLPVYLLSVAASGAKLTRNDTGKPLPQLRYRTVPGGVSLPAVNASMLDLANSLQKGVLDRPVMDKTELEGRYNFLLIWRPDASQFAGSYRRAPSPANSYAPPDLFTALQEQLGLQLQPGSASFEALVVEHVEPPLEN